MADLIKWCDYIKFCFELGKNAMETFEMLKVTFGGQKM
jgi:hypothetical protein